MPYEIQHNTLADGWINTWLFDDGDGLKSETFASEAEARAALDEHLEDLAEEFRAGHIGRYDPSEFRVQYVPETSIQPLTHQQGDTP